MTSTDVGVADFKGWRNDQVVHVSSHGATALQALACRAIIAAGILTGPAAAVPEAGVDLLKSADGRTYIALGADFFRRQYRAGWTGRSSSSTPAARTAPKATDLGDTIRGQTSVFLGWTEPVDSVAAQDAATALYASLGRDGFAVDAAYDALGKLQVDATPGGKKARLKRGRPGDGRRPADPRGHHVPHLERLDALGPGPRPIQGRRRRRAAGRASPITSRSTAWRRRPRRSRRSRSASMARRPRPSPSPPGRRSSQGAGRSTARSTSGTTWTTNGPSTSRPRWTCPRAVSAHTRRRATISVGPAMGGSWSGWATDVGDANGDGSVKVRSRAELTFSYIAGQKGGATHPRYELTDGTLSWQIDGTSSAGCRVLSPEITLDDLRLRFRCIARLRPDEGPGRVHHVGQRPVGPRGRGRRDVPGQELHVQHPGLVHVQRRARSPDRERRHRLGVISVRRGRIRVGDASAGLSMRRRRPPGSGRRLGDPPETQKGEFRRADLGRTPAGSSRRRGPSGSSCRARDGSRRSRAARRHSER